MPFATALIDTYNHQRFIEQALVSAVEQDFPSDELEIIVVDDGSTDRTPEIVRKFAPRVRLIQKANGGQVSSFNAGVAKTNGQIIAFLDGDDWWERSKISRVVKAFEADPDVAAVGHGYYEVDDNGIVRGQWTPDEGARLSLEMPALALKSTSLRIFLGTSRFSVRKSVLLRTLPIPPELPFFDNFVFSQAVAIGGAVLLREPLCYYRVHSGSLYASQVATEKRLRTRYTLLKALLDNLPERLRSFAISDAAISAFLDFDRSEMQRLKLMLQGGWPWETCRVEAMSYRQEYRNPDWRYRVFKGFVLLSTLLMPPKSFYRMRRWYSKQALRQWREKLGHVSAVVPHVVRRPVEPAEPEAR